MKRLIARPPHLHPYLALFSLYFFYFTYPLQAQEQSILDSNNSAVIQSSEHIDPATENAGSGTNANESQQQKQPQANVGLFPILCAYRPRCRECRKI